ncbi:MAG: recombinase family protein [Varibaculum sp.]|nr:recombinase family protein [Varibaculum sp.]
MGRQVQQVIHPKREITRTRVAAYVRVSRESERLTHSFSAQVSHYNQLISATPGWEYAGVYSDYSASGTSTTKRDEFKDMITTALNGGIDIILTKSISRFARNTVDLLETVRELSAAGVSVRFERENLDTATAEGEILLTLLASFAQAESESISANAKWGIRKKYADGHLHSRQPYGYHYNHGHLEIIEQEAMIVQRVFTEFLKGISPEKTVNALNAEGLRSRSGGKFRANVTRQWLENETYTGDAICQKYYRPHVGKSTSSPNTGQLTKYLVEDSHPAIITRDVFDAVQAELEKRRNSGGLAATPGFGTGLTHIIVCATCGKHYHRRTKTQNGQSYKYWWCETATKGQGNPCKAHQLREEKLRTIICTALGLADWDDETIINQIEHIEASPDWLLTIDHTSGRRTTIDYRTGLEVDH